MSRIILVTFSIASILLALTSFAPQQNNTKAHIQFKAESFNYGTIEVNSDGNHVFEFTNTGQSPLIISQVQSSCGCTVAKKPAEQIDPGKSEVIKVRYNTSRVGAFRKTITVISNADNNKVVLQISGKVIPKPKEEMPVKPQGGFTPTAK